MRDFRLPGVSGGAAIRAWRPCWPSRLRPGAVGGGFRGQCAYLATDSSTGMKVWNNFPGIHS